MSIRMLGALWPETIWNVGKLLILLNSVICKTILFPEGSTIVDYSDKEVK